MHKQYTTSLPDGTAVHWRALTWGEYRKLTNTLEIEEGPAIWHLYDAVAGLCIISFECPIASDYDDLPAGVIESVGETILSQTGFVPTKELVQKQIDAARGRIHRDYYYTGVAYICTAFNYKPTEVDKFTVEEFMNHLVMAETALGIDINIPSDEPESKIQYREIPDPRTGQTIKVPIATPRGKQSKIDIRNGNQRQ